MTIYRTINSHDFLNRPLWLKVLNNSWERIYSIRNEPSLNRDDLIRTARKSTNLMDLGKDFQEDPLDRLILSLNQEARLHPVGRFISRKRIINLLTVRLKAEYWFKRHPEILEMELNPPWVITGLQRTGTTKLHRLLTADPENRILKSWEAINPAPHHKYFPYRDKRSRIARTTEKALRVLAPGFFAIHPVEHSAPEEDILLLDATFLSTTPEATLHVPSYAAWLEDTDQSQAYEYGSKLLRLLQWQQPSRRWVLKSPHHLEFLPLIEKYYGKPRVIWTHRNLAECIPSFLSMVCHSRAIFSDDVKISEVTDHWVRKTSHMLNQALIYRNSANQDQFIDVRYDELVSESIKQLARIYEGYGGISDELEGRFLFTESVNPQGKYGIHNYHPGDFGLNHDELILRNKAYHELFLSLNKTKLLA